MMFMIVRTGSGRKYARRIGQELKKINPRNKWLIPSVSYFPESFRQRPWLTPRNTIIHARAAYPDGPMWVANLVEKENEGYRVINDTRCTRLTSHKLECGLVMYNAGLPHPRTWEANRSDSPDRLRNLYYRIRSSEFDYHGKIVVKPYTSMEQGANVRLASTEHQFIDTVQAMPTGKVIVQECINYNAIYRVIVIGGRALPMSWLDAPSHDRWRVSVCLNKNMAFVRNPDNELLRIAEQTQQVVGGEISFVDIFRTLTGRYILSEINTACNLSIHEQKARAHGHPYWNIARQIALYLDRQARGMHGYYT